MELQKSLTNREKELEALRALRKEKEAHHRQMVPGIDSFLKNEFV